MRSTVSLIYFNKSSLSGPRYICLLTDLHECLPNDWNMMPACAQYVITCLLLLYSRIARLSIPCPQIKLQKSLIINVPFIWLNHKQHIAIIDFR